MAVSALRILIIDDNPVVQANFVYLLTSHQAQAENHTNLEESSMVFQLDTAAHGIESTEKIQMALKRGKPYALAFVTVKISTENMELATIHDIWELDRDIQVILCVSHADKAWEACMQQLKPQDNLLVVTWPFESIAIRQLACTLSKKWLLTQEIRNKVQLLNKAGYQASHDSLTDLPNRILFNDRIEQAIANASRHAGNFGVLFLDLDRFKLINDSFSHQLGDELLQAVALRLSSLLRKVDTLARMGGDEFVMIIPELTQESSILHVVQKILLSFETPFQVSEHSFNITTSIGISIYPIDGSRASVLLRYADLAMYQAKELGGHQFKFYTQVLNEQNQRRILLEEELRNAIKNNEFYLVYQPQMDIHAGQLLSVEALIRWKHPTKGEILPLNFIPVAQETGLIIPIGDWVIRTVCHQINVWRKKNLEILVAVNVASQQLEQQNFAMEIKKILNQYKIPAKFLHLEITENVLITHPQIRNMISELKEMGITMVLDDFGMGSSSLNYLKEIQINHLKTNRSIVKNMAQTEHEDTRIKAMMNKARDMNFKISAIGVETQNQINFLKTHQYNEAQGFLLSKPLSANDIEIFIKNIN